MSDLVEQLEAITRGYYAGRLLQVATQRDPIVEHWQRWAATQRKYRYTSKSRRRPHEFSGADAKAVFRRMRSDKPVSPKLVQQAADALWKAGYDRGLVDAD